MKKIVRAAIAATLMFIFGHVTAQDSSKKNLLTLQQSVDIALKNNLQVKQSELAADRSAINLNQARSNRLPDLLADLTHGLNQGRSIDPFTNGYINQSIFFGNYNLSTNVILFNGGQLKNLVKQNKLDYEAGKSDLQQSKDNLMLNVLLAYLQILNNQEQYNQSVNQLALTKKQVERLTQLNTEGAIIPSQLYELKGQQASDELSMISNRAAVESATLSLCQLMNIPYSKEIKIQQVSAENFTLKYEDDTEKIYRQALSILSSIKAADLRTQSTLQGVKAARSAFYPVVSFSANIYTNYSNAALKENFLNTVQSASGDFVNVGGTELPVISTSNVYSSEKIRYPDQFRNNYSTSLGVNVRVPIFNQNRAKNNLALAKNDQNNAEYVLETARIQLKQSVEQAVLNRNASYEKYNLLLQQVNDFDSAFKIADVRYQAGVSTQVDYLIAKNNSDRAAINLIIAKYDYIFRMKILDYYGGKLVL